MLGCAVCAVMSDSLWPLGLQLQASVHEIAQVRILEQIAISSSKESSQPRDWTHISHIAGRFILLLSHWGSPSLSSGYSFYRRRNPRPRKVKWDVWVQNPWILFLSQGLDTATLKCFIIDPPFLEWIFQCNLMAIVNNFLKDSRMWINNKLCL